VGDGATKGVIRMFRASEEISCVYTVTVYRHAAFVFRVFFFSPQDISAFCA
jgi:hypothetical protein